MTLENDMARIERQEAELRFAHFDENDAFRLGVILRDEALRRGVAVAIGIRTANRALFHASTPGATADNDDWIRRKSNTVLRVGRSSFGFQHYLKKREQTISSARGMDLMDHAADGGCFPIHVTGTGIVAAVTVSGLPQREDHRLVTWGICKFLGVDPEAYDIGPA